LHTFVPGPAVADPPTGVQNHPEVATAPVLEMKAVRIAAAVEEFKNAFPNVRYFYATKCNTDPGVLRVLDAAGSRFEVASVAEITVLRSLGIRGQDLLFSNPVRAREQTRQAARAGVYRFAVDSVEELHRVADEAPGSCVYARLSTGGTSLVPSEGKFGVGVPGAIDLLVRARTLGLVPYGVTFHIGSQSLSPAALTGPLEDVHTVLARLVSHGIRLQMVDIGGGFPAVYDKPVPSLAAFGRATAAGIAHLPYPVEVFAEPGRCLVAEAGTFRCRVIGVARRPSGWWAHTDLGVFNGMMEVLESGGELRYPIWDTRRAGPRRSWHITGPTCDGQDTYARDVPLSADLREGDELSIGSAGAYTTVS
jgi:ornithine decarboxylase